MKILVIGSGGREHAFCWALKNAPSKPEIFCAPGNAGIAQDATCVALDSHDAIADFCHDKGIDYVIIGPEQPLVDGLSDDLRSRDILVVGPSQAAAELEASKDFTKRLCTKYNIPTAKHMTFQNAQEAISYVKEQGAPIVVKADGLAAGKGVTVAESVQQAIDAIEECFSGKFGQAGESLVIEECLIGEEASVFALCDGENAIPLGSAQDHKRVGEGDTGANTGGMGTYSPAPVMTDTLSQQVMDDIILPSLKGMAADGRPYHGILFAGLMITDQGPKLIEYNCRFGDPEAQVLLPRIEGDIAQLFFRAAKGELHNETVSLSDKAALCVVMAANGYPASYKKGTEIKNISTAAAMDDVIVYHAGTAEDAGKLLAIGGRVLGVTALSSSIEAAQSKAYQAVDSIDWPEGFCRRDIGWRAIERKKAS